MLGTDDPHIYRDDYALVAGNFDPRADLRLGVTHAPYLRVLDAMAADGAELILAGHTHGGQVYLPGFGTLVTNCDLDRARARGSLATRTRGCTCRQAWAPIRTRRSGSPAHRKPRC